MTEGRTSKQLREAPVDAIFICWGPLFYTKSLALHLQRGDLVIRTVDIFQDPAQLMSTKRKVVIDHAAELTHREQEVWQIYCHRERSR